MKNWIKILFLNTLRPEMELKSQIWLHVADRRTVNKVLFPSTLQPRMKLFDWTVPIKQVLTELNNYLTILCNHGWHVSIEPSQGSRAGLNYITIRESKADGIGIKNSILSLYER